MDTTAAAELAVGVSPGNGAWVGGNGDPETWSDDDYDAEDSEWVKDRRYHDFHHPSRHVHPPEKRAKSMVGDGGALYSGRLGGSGDHAVGSGYSNDHGGPSPENYEFQGQRAANGGGGLQKQGSMRGSNSFSGEMGSTIAESSPAGGASSSMARGKGTGSIFFKTKLCCKFRAGTCPYNSNCNFAHGMEELRKPPPGWEEMVAAQEAERVLRGGRDGQVQVVVEPTGAGVSGDSQRFHKTPRPCRKYYTEEGCPYGDRCIFLHDDQGSQVRVLRESNAISLGPMTSLVNGAASAGGASERPSNWKTRVCNKWETTGHCPFGQKCHFVHGTSDGHNSALNSRHGGGVAVSFQSQRQGSKAHLKWKGPADEISTIYGDWIEEDEWEIPSVSVMAG